MKLNLTEYPLFEFFSMCPTARFVGGTSRYLCECRDPDGCAGVLARRKYIR